MFKLAVIADLAFLSNRENQDYITSQLDLLLSNKLKDGDVSITSVENSYIEHITPLCLITYCTERSIILNTINNSGGNVNGARDIQLSVDCDALLLFISPTTWPDFEQTHKVFEMAKKRVVLRHEEPQL
ncbi:hypothetical protein A6E01_20780 (plasmid) [Vibrio breoganii]|uniref:Uncharacterized protein n=1 Tax=Vibrio breoganii TaxID=553239 RepID=A0AAN0Y0H2_9VIBR|nr:hypothetical protein A6E01_20780 [Vibrio breoganii]